MLTSNLEYTYLSNNLLIVEDNYLIGDKILDASLKSKKFKNVKLTYTLKQAINYLKSNSVKLVSLDLSLPDGNGIELLKWFNKNNINTKVYVFSTNKELKSTCLRYGAKAFFDKSKDFDKLMITLQNTIL